MCVRVWVGSRGSVESLHQRVVPAGAADACRPANRPTHRPVSGMFMYHDELDVRR